MKPLAKRRGEKERAERLARASAGPPEREGTPLLRKGSLESIDEFGGFGEDGGKTQPAIRSAEKSSEEGDPVHQRRSWEQDRPPSADGPEVAEHARSTGVPPPEAAAHVVGAWAQQGYATARNVGDLAMTSARVWEHIGASAGHFGGASARQFTQVAGTRAHAAHRAAAQRLGVDLPADATPVAAYNARHPAAPPGAPNAERPAAAEAAGKPSGGPAPVMAAAAPEDATARSRPLGDSAGAVEPPRAGPHVIRRRPDQTVPDPPALRGGSMDEKDKAHV
jgi:hypothetical protein